MKTSNKILMITLCVIGGFVLVVTVFSSILIGTGMDSVDTEKGYGELVTIAFDIRDFSGIEVNGTWEVNVKKSDTFGVVVRVPESLREKIDVRKEGASLVIGLVPGVKIHGEINIFAEISMPDIERLEESGVASVNLSGFACRNLRVVSSGVGSISCRDSSIENLEIELSGVGSIDFTDARAKNADVELSGIGSVQLTMDGGAIRTSINGMGSLEYGGTVSSENIYKSGLGSVHRL